MYRPRRVWFWMTNATARHASANQTPQGKPNTRWIASPRIKGSLILMAMPPSSAFAIPTPMNHEPSVAMKEGMRSQTCTTPLNAPVAIPTNSVTGNDQ